MTKSLEASSEKLIEDAFRQMRVRPASEPITSFNEIKNNRESYIGKTVNVDGFCGFVSGNFYLFKEGGKYDINDSMLLETDNLSREVRELLNVIFKDKSAFIEMKVVVKANSLNVIEVFLNVS
jgi:uncharacterized Fe-S cluster-containing protein